MRKSAQLGVIFVFCVRTVRAQAILAKYRTVSCIRRTYVQDAPQNLVLISGSKVYFKIRHTPSFDVQLWGKTVRLIRDGTVTATFSFVPFSHRRTRQTQNWFFYCICYSRVSQILNTSFGFFFLFQQNEK